VRTYRNPFRARASEQHGDPLTFLRNFGAGVLEALDDTIWDRPLLLRSAPGGGKTSLMRLFSLETLGALDRRREEFPELVRELERIGALEETGPTHAGMLLNLDGDYRALLDLGLPPEQMLRQFYRLLDARIMLATLRAALLHHGLHEPSSLRLVPLAPLSDAESVADLRGGLDGRDLWETARLNERSVIRPLDALLPDDPAQSSSPTVGSLLSLRLLSLTRIQVGEQDLPTPLIMLDDGHGLAPSQRQALLRALEDRSLQVARWYAERYEALDEDEMLIGSGQGRDFLAVELESDAREKRRAERLMQDVATRRARPYLLDYGNVEQTFIDLIRVDESELLGGSERRVIDDLWRRLGEAAEGDLRYVDWLAALEDSSGYSGAVRLRELLILIAADHERAQGELFSHPLAFSDFTKRRTRISSVAPHFLARDYRLPYYFGPHRISQLGSENVDQFLRLAGDFFEEMLGELTIRRGVPRLNAGQQDRIVHRASERYWRELTQRVSHGSLVRRLVTAILELAQAQTFRATAPYAPGVTGTALTMEDRQRLLDPKERRKLSGAQDLFEAIGAGVAGNVFSVQLDYSSKNQRVMIIYLNRLLCPRFNLPLGRGGFRERKLETMAAWMMGERRGSADEALEIYPLEQLTL
jgi:hypothetical protein